MLKCLHLYKICDRYCVVVCFALGGLFGPQALAPAQSNQLINTASALSAPTLLNDERDAILAKWNQLQAFWGTGKGYFNNIIPPVDFTQENPFCRFKVRLPIDKSFGIGLEQVCSCSKMMLCGS